MAAAKKICHMFYVHDASYLVYIAPGLLSCCPGLMLFVEINDHYITPCPIPWSRDLMERNIYIYGHSNQIEGVTKQWETYAGSGHHPPPATKEVSHMHMLPKIVNPNGI